MAIITQNQHKYIQELGNYYICIQAWQRYKCSIAYREYQRLIRFYQFKASTYIDPHSEVTHRWIYAQNQIIHTKSGRKI